MKGPGILGSDRIGEGGAVAIGLQLVDEADDDEEKRPRNPGGDDEEAKVDAIRTSDAARDRAADVLLRYLASWRLSAEPRHRPPHRDAVRRATVSRHGRDIERRGAAPQRIRIACRNLRRIRRRPTPNTPLDYRGGHPMDCD